MVAFVLAVACHSCLASYTQPGAHISAKSRTPKEFFHFKASLEEGISAYLDGARAFLFYGRSLSRSFALSLCRRRLTLLLLLPRVYFLFSGTTDRRRLNPSATCRTCVQRHLRLNTCHHRKGNIERCLVVGKHRAHCLNTWSRARRPRRHVWGNGWKTRPISGRSTSARVHQVDIWEHKLHCAQCLRKEFSGSFTGTVQSGRELRCLSLMQTVVITCLTVNSKRYSH